MSNHSFGTSFPASRSGSVGVVAAMMFGALMLVGSLSMNQAHMHYTGLLQRQTTQAAAMAAAAKLSSYYASGNQSTATIVSAAQTISTANMPTAKYGNVIQASNVVLGNWNPQDRTFATLASSGGSNPNAVQIQGVSSAANGNPISMLMTSLPGRDAADYTTTAIASYGTGQTWNTIITNDLSGSFSGQIANQRAADLAILDCVRTAAGTASQFGITTHTGISAIFQPLSQASANFATLSTKIGTLKSCGNSGAPACSGSNVASAIYSARMQFADAAYNNTRKNIVIITDGIPNGISRTYTRADGIYPNDAVGTAPTCTTNCSDANTWTMAVNQATMARNAGISISTIYYSGNTAANMQATYKAQLAALTGGTGVAMVAPSTGQIAGVFAGFCSTMSSALKAVY